MLFQLQKHLGVPYCWLQFMRLYLKKLMSASKLNMIGGSQIKAVAVWLVYELGQRYQSHQNCAVFMNNPIKSTVAYFTIVVDEFDEILNHRI